VRTSPSRILLVAFTPFPAPTGAATRLAQRILSLTAAGYSLDVITPKAGTLPHVSTLGTARIFRVPLTGLRDSSPGPARMRESSALALSDQLAAFERAVRRQLQGNEYDAIHVMDPSATAAILNNRGEAVLAYESGGSNLAPNDPDLATELQRRHARLLDSADAVFVPSRVAAVEAENAGAWPARVQLLRPSVDLELYQPSPDLSRRGSSICRIAIVASRLHADELSLIGGALLRLNEGVEVRVIVSAAVDPDDRAQLESDAALRERFALHDPVLYDDLVPFYSSCDAGLVLSTRASGSNVRLQSAAEIFAAGLAPILPDVPATRELVKGESDALLYPPDDIAELVKAIELVATNATLRRLLGRTARQVAVRQLDEKRASTALVGVYHRLLSKVERVSEETPRPVGDLAHQIPQHINSLMRQSDSPDKGGQAGPSATVSQRTPSRPPFRENPPPSDDLTVPDGSPEARERTPGGNRPR
jgi:glycosyltransferase involved in cell wall biosynthesis